MELHPISNVWRPVGGICILISRLERKISSVLTLVLSPYILCHKIC